MKENLAITSSPVLPKWAKLPLLRLPKKATFLDHPRKVSKMKLISKTHLTAARKTGTVQTAGARGPLALLTFDNKTRPMVVLCQHYCQRHFAQNSYVQTAIISGRDPEPALRQPEPTLR